MERIKKNYLILFFLKNILKNIKEIKTDKINNKSHVKTSLVVILFKLVKLFILLPINIENNIIGVIPINVENINL